jgi:hypothetical protein
LRIVVGVTPATAAASFVVMVLLSFAPSPGLQGAPGVGVGYSL